MRRAQFVAGPPVGALSASMDSRGHPLELTTLDASLKDLPTMRAHAKLPSAEPMEGDRKKLFNARVAALKKDFLVQKQERTESELQKARSRVRTLVERVQKQIQARPSAPFQTSAASAAGDDRRSTSGRTTTECKDEGSKDGGEEEGGARTPSDAVNGERRDPWQLPLNKVVKVKQRMGIKKPSWMRAQYKANRIPRCNTIPPYASWVYITKNASNQDNDKRMFYTDDKGESVPASDDEGESWAAWMWNGYNSDWRAFCVETILTELGHSRETVVMLGDKFKVEPEIVEARARELERKKIPPPDPDDVTLEVILQKFRGLCRRCRMYECVLHGGDHIQPHIKPPACSEQRSEPCGPNCCMIRSRKRRTSREEAEDGDAPAKRSRHDAASPLNVGKSGMARWSFSSRAYSPRQSPSAGSPLAQRGSRQSPGRGSGGQRTPGGKGRIVSPRMQNASTPRRSQAVGSASPHQALTAKGGSLTPPATGTSAKSPRIRGSRQGSFTTLELSFVNKGLEIFGSNPCFIARLVGTKSCYEVHLFLKRNPNLIATAAGANKARRNKLKGKQTAVQKRFHHNEAELWHQYTPCKCVGPCTSSCVCIKSGNFCERFCACFRNCQNQFRGCKCKGQCSSLRCPCLAASRECDPDICKGCSQTCLPNCPPGLQCHNMNLRLRRHKKIAMGLSMVAGWGAFLMESAKKDDFLGEYTGDLISDQEAERRGSVYDRQDKSYLFNLTKEGVLDANRRGNKLRFANHSLNPNCFVKYMLVDGDHQVGIFASRDIKAGEELFYDYGAAWSSKWYDPEDSDN